MASLNPRYAPRRKTQTASRSSAAAANGDLLLDGMWEVLLRLSAKELCRLRLVCRLWRSITSNPAFIAAHKARHPETLLVGGRRGEFPMYKGYILVMDLSGNVVKWIRSKWFYSVLPTRHDLVCITGVGVDSSGAHGLNPATGFWHPLPNNLAREHSHGRYSGDYSASFIFEQVSAGEYKVLRVLKGTMLGNLDTEQIVEVLTLKAGVPMQWRAKQAPPFRVSMSDFRRVVVKGVVYFLKDDNFNRISRPDCMALFDLKTEEWIASSLKGPLSSDPELDDRLHNRENYNYVRNLQLAELNDFLVEAAQICFCSGSSLDLWYLMDMENSRWERKHRIPMGKVDIDEYNFYVAYSLMVLQDDRILICAQERRIIEDDPGEPDSSYRTYTDLVVQIYDPNTNTFGPDKMKVRNMHSVGFFVGSLLSVRNGEL